MNRLIQAISEKKYELAKNVLDERISDVVSRKLFEVKKSLLAKISEADVPIPRPSPIPTPNQTNAAKGAIRKELGIQKIIKDQGNSPSNWKEKTGGELPSNPPKNPTLRQSKVERFAEETRAEKYAAKKAAWEAKEKPYKKEKMSDKRLDALKAKLGITTKKFHDDIHSKVAKIGQYAQGSLEEEEDLQEASFKIVKARVRGGKIQRRKKVSTRPGYTFRGGKLVRMSPAERRRRKMGARRGKIKRRSKMNRANMKRARSNRKRNALGLNRKPGRR